MYVIKIMVESIDSQIKDLSLSDGLTVLIVLGMAGTGKTTFVQVSKPMVLLVEIDL